MCIARILLHQLNFSSLFASIMLNLFSGLKFTVFSVRCCFQLLVDQHVVIINQYVITAIVCMLLSPASLLTGCVQLPQHVYVPILVRKKIMASTRYSRTIHFATVFNRTKRLEVGLRRMSFQVVYDYRTSTSLILLSSAYLLHRKPTPDRNSYHLT